MLRPMEPDKDKSRRKAPRPEFEVAYYTKELGRDLQRKLLRERLADLGQSGRASSHGEDASNDWDAAAPPDERAG